MATKKVPRGIRNNNPLNIRIGNVWLGEVANPTDTEFEQFVNPLYGIRAAFVLFRRYINRYHLDTPAKFIARWAPGNENNTNAYITNVCKRMKCCPDDKLNFSDKSQMYALFQAMCFVENGQTMSDDMVSKAYKLS